MSHALAQEPRSVARRIGRWVGDNPHLVWALLIGAALLGASTAAILNLRSVKYLIGLITVGAGVSAFVGLRNRHSVLLFATGFSLPFYLRLSLLERDRESLSLTGVALVVLMLGIVVIGIRSADRPKPSLGLAVTLPALLYLGASAFSFITTMDRTLSFLASIRDAEMILLFLILLNAVWHEEHLTTFLRGLYASFAIECVIYGIQNAFGVSFDVLGNTKLVRATDVDSGYIGSQRGTFDSAPAVAALYFSLMSLTFIGLYLCRRKLAIRLPPALGVMMGVGCLALAAKRAPLAGFAIGLVVMCGLLAKHVPGAVRKLAPVLIALAFPLLVFAPILLLRAEANHEAAYEERMNLTRVAWRMWHAHPIVGVGVGTYDSVKRAYLPEDWSGWLYTVHNNYLMVLAETGIVGFAGLIILYAAVFWSAYRGIAQIAPGFRPLQIALVGCFVAIFWEMYWDIFNGRQQLYMLWFLIALSLLLPRILRESVPASGA